MATEDAANLSLAPGNASANEEEGVTKTNWDDVYNETWIDETPNSARTDIAVIYRVWSWDLMPPDMIRPLSVISTRDIILLALRLGMKWRHLDPSSGKFEADGNSYTISSVDVRGLGAVLRFTSAGSHVPYPRLIPGREADKMIFGILPGDPILVKKDSPMVDSNRKLQGLANLYSTLKTIGVVAYLPPRNGPLRDCNDPEIKNDAITLLLPLLPVNGSRNIYHYFPGWHIDSDHYITCVYASPGGRAALRDGLCS
ncbi:hypothetical protein P280DRAFT_85846 [Massarina eburnea CBS 473.64]|uniref:Uncharacterized protein n=1 Tax=Massarina eburnea CBS 473.64 TaxID=1395130 RepID=A0A6A6RR44_9PLEO|nr:hypothetical protein P280DRAFT_85846 [Massarina eburnea CBS 473.64]